MRPERITQALGLPDPVGELTPLTYSSSQTWTLETTDGRVLLKHLPLDRPAAMAFERKARSAAIAMPTPLGHPAHVDGIGLTRAYAWIDGRPVGESDDIAAWLGETLARLHAIEPADRAGPDWYHLHDERWHDWLHAAERPWTPALREHLPDILAATDWVARAFADTADHVTTHRDIEIHNIMVTAAGPVLIDWDSAGPDSAGLETAHATYSLATHHRAGPDRATIRCVLDAYTANGGTRPTGTGILARRAGIRLGRLAERLRMSLGEEPAGPRDLTGIEARAEAQIRSIPAFTRDLIRYADLFS
ncbi:aminoglycoside phosphotransferase family protein [Actinoplanes sp. NPDC049118]|uniref:aminoglycoside phosphotransferase family protein n=1 Tax=Actinoplanes sp. NPDC049118 TaxID=3155769 RepID=UPI0033C5B2F4